jgi:hypothetical protein
MKTILRMGLLLLAGALGAAEEKAPAPESPLAPLASLVGGLWVCPVPAPAGSAPVSIELRFEWTENRRAIRFDSAFVQGDKRKPYTSGMYGWNAAKGKIVIFYMDSGGSLTEGDITQENGMFVNDLHSTGPEGKVTPVRVQLTKEGDDAFVNDIYVQKDGAWAPLVKVRYERRK